MQQTPYVGLNGFGTASTSDREDRRYPSNGNHKSRSSYACMQRLDMSEPQEIIKIQIDGEFGG